MIWYIQGCDVIRNHPDAGIHAGAYFDEKKIAKGPCCKKDFSCIKAGDTLITNCTQCDLIFPERVPEAEIISLYEFVLQDHDFSWPDYEGREMLLQDCWRTRNNTKLQEAVRMCLEKMNIRIREVNRNRKEADFCGVWMNNPAAPESVEAAPVTFARLEPYRHLLDHAEQQKKMQEYISRYPELPYAVYCNGCEKGIRLGGGKPVHMIDLLFSDPLFE